MGIPGDLWLDLSGESFFFGFVSEFMDAAATWELAESKHHHHDEHKWDCRILDCHDCDCAIVWDEAEDLAEANEAV